MLKTIGETLKKFRNEKNLSVKRISDILTENGYKASESTIYSWENNNSQPTPGAFLLMCQVYGIDNILSSFGYLPLINQKFKLEKSEEAYIKKYRSLDTHGKEITDIVIQKELERIERQDKILAADYDNEPDSIIELVFANSKASAGTGALLIDDGGEVIKVLYNEDTRKADICIEVSGDSMEPRYSNGDILLVRRQPDIDINEIGIFMINDEGFVKKKGSDRLVSLNEAYDDIYPNEYDDVLCYGKVVGILDERMIVEK